MSNIQITKIDGQEFVPLKDYKILVERNEEKMIKIRELEEENKKLREWIKSDGQIVTMRECNIYRLEEENIKLKSDLEQIKETYIRFEDSEKEYNKWLWELDQLIMNR